MSGLKSRLAAAVLSKSPVPVDPGLVPTAVSAACAEVLGVDGAGLSLIGDLRVPLAASTTEVRRAEQLQTTLGEGPCLAAVAADQPLAAGPVKMMQQWPVFHHELARQTSFRSVVALPIAAAGQQPFGALDLYFTDAEPDRGLLEDPVRGDIVQVVAAFLTGPSLADLLDGDNRARLSAADTSAVLAERLNVWTAIGMVMAASGSNQADALAQLRAHAFHHGSTLDETAHLMTTRQLPAQELLD